MIEGRMETQKYWEKNHPPPHGLYDLATEFWSLACVWKN